MNRLCRIALLLVVAGTATWDLRLTAQSTAAQAPSIPAHPRELRFRPLSFTPPDPAALRHVLRNQVVAYMVEDHELPIVTVTVLIRGGGYLDPNGREGLASLTGSQIRSGTRSLTAEAFDEEVDFLAANLGASFGPTSGSASVNFLAKDTDRALDLFFEMLRTPRFEQERLDLAKAQRVQALERRNDSTDSIEAREWTRLIRGEGHFSTRQVTKASTEALTRDDLVRFHRDYVHPGNFIIAVAGDFKTDEMKTKLVARMAGWQPSGVPVPPIPKPAHQPVPGVYVVDKPDVNQGRVTIGHVGIERGNPDEVAVDMMNDVLGGSGFTSRITNRVRSDEGLAYDAGSSFVPGTYYPGTFDASFQSRNESCARATAIVLEEIERIRREPVAPDELETVKTSAIETFPRRFASASAVATLYAGDELTGRDPRYWLTWRDRVRRVTIADVQRVAQQYLRPERLVILAVGNADAMLAGDPDHPAHSFAKLSPGGAITRIPLPDPLTMRYP